MRFLKYMIMLMDEAGDDQGGGSGPDIATLQAQVAELTAKLNAKSDPPKDELDDDLNNKASKIKEGRDKEASLESALQFNLTADRFLEENKSILPEDVQDIFEASKKENFDSQVQKANAIKQGIVQSFFHIQENLDLLTDRQKKDVENYFKLSKNGREDKVQFIFDNIFEPTLGLLKRVKKAEELNLKSKGLHKGTDAELAYIDKLKRLSRSRYLGEKES